MKESNWNCGNLKRGEEVLKSLRIIGVLGFRIRWSVLMYRDMEITPDDEDEIIMMVAQEIRKYGMEAAAILFLETAIPLSFIGAQTGRFLISPFLPAISEEVGIKGEKMFRVFEKHGNIEKLIATLEEMGREKKKEEKKKREAEKVQRKDGEKTAGKSGWRRFLPF